VRSSSDLAEHFVGKGLIIEPVWEDGILSRRFSNITVLRSHKILLLERCDHFTVALTPSELTSSVSLSNRENRLKKLDRFIFRQQFDHIRAVSFEFSNTCSTNIFYWRLLLISPSSSVHRPAGLMQVS
jgi:hypothetical protein